MATTATLEPTPTASKPVRVFRDSGLSVSVFRNQVKVRDRDVTFHNVSLQRTYKDGGTFKATHSLGKDDLPVAQLLLNQAWAWIVTEEARLRQKAVA